MSEDAEKSAKSEKDSRVTIFMVGNSRGNKHGQRRLVDPAIADKLVANGHARRPASAQE